jgi:hypothetical protein
LRAHLELLTNPPTKADTGALTETVRTERAPESGE